MTVSARWSRILIAACERSQRQTGENALCTKDSWIGVGCSFNRSVSANATAVATRTASTTITAAWRRTPKIVPLFERPRRRHAVREPDGDAPPRKRKRAEAEAGRDHIAGVRQVEQLDPAQREHAREAEAQGILGQLDREAARKPDAGDRPEQQPRHCMQIDVALHEVAEP